MRPLVPALIAFALLAAGPALAQDSSQDAERLALARAVADTERAFDAYTAEHGFTAGFLEFTAPNGILFRPDPVNVREYLTAREPSTDTALRWGPYRVGVAASGDLAWDTGPWTYGDNAAHGWFFTIWERQPDGNWRWALDHGSGSSPAHVPVPAPEEVIVDRAARGTRFPASDPWTEVAAMDGRLNALLVAESAEMAYANIRAEDFWASTPDQGPAMTRDTAWEALQARPSYDAFEPIGGRASAAGDLAYTYGHVRWGDGEVQSRGHYIRVWRRDGRGPEGWRLVYDQLSPVPQPQS